MNREIIIEDMTQAIKQLEAEGYTDVKVVSCRYWKGEKK